MSDGIWIALITSGFGVIGLIGSAFVTGLFALRMRQLDRRPEEEADDDVES